MANGHPGGGLWRQYYGKACEPYFPETTGTVFFGKRQAVPMLLFVLAALVEGRGIGAAGRVFGLEADTGVKTLNNNHRVNDNSAFTAVRRRGSELLSSGTYLSKDSPPSTKTLQIL